MIKFNDNNIYVGYIKELLHSFNLPCCQIDAPGNKYYVNEYFINSTKNAIHKVVSVNSDNTLKESSKVCDYKIGDKVLNITKNLEIKNNYYDTYTHEYLGNFLRFIRDFLGVDMMSMYNCFTNASPVLLNKTISDEVFTTQDKDYNIYMIPVKPNTEYTIALEYSSILSMFCGFYGYNKYQELYEGIMSSQDTDIAEDSFKRIKSSTFNRPFIYKTPEVKPISTSQQGVIVVDPMKQVKNLKLFIKVPATFSKNIVVLEGNFVNSTNLVLEGFEQRLAKKLIYKPTKDVDGVEKYVFKENPIVAGFDDYTTKNQLLSICTDTKYLLADRLVEYLSMNAILPYDYVIDNIRRLQVILAGDVDRNFKFTTYGIWEDDLRRQLNLLLEESDEINKHFDLLSYGDKDVEMLLKTLKLSKQAQSVLSELGEI